ncbi:MAG TPA: hypothetical protein PKJ47_13640 [Candidatus Limiplasma sp.]|nr:hypothetical protein [Candidatus Limiplasma sp.]
MQTQQTSPREKAKRIRLTMAEIKKLPREYQHEIAGAIRLLEIQRSKQPA